MRTTSDGRLAGVGHASRFTTQLSSFTLLAGVAAVTLPIHEAYAQAVRVTACDILTAHPDDRLRVSDPVSITERDAARALPACEEALRTDPNNARLRYQLGLAYDTARRFTDSFAAYQQAAQAGYVAAGHALAWAYANAEGTERNDAEAVRWYRWAAERGHTGSMNTLGFMLENGRGAPRDLIQAADWYRRAYDTDGRPIAAFNWARLLSGGRGVPQDNARAVQLFRVAAQAGRADAALQLALMAERGEAPQVTQAELIQLLAMAETGAAQRDRARRSINQQIAAGNGAAVDAARNTVAENIQTRLREEEAARQRREQALARVTQPAVASAPGERVTAGTSAQPPGVPATPGASAQPAWLSTLWSNPVALAGAAGGIAVLLAGLGFRLGNRRGRQAAASVRQEPYVAPMPLVAAVAERSATMAPPAVAVSSRTAVPSSMDTSTKVASGATQSVPAVQGTNQPDTPSVNSLDKQLPSQDPEQAHKAWLAEAEARRVEAVRDWESRQQTARPVSAKSPSDHHADVQKRAMDEFARRQVEKSAVEQPHFAREQQPGKRRVQLVISSLALGAALLFLLLDRSAPKTTAAQQRQAAQAPQQNERPAATAVAPVPTFPVPAPSAVAASGPRAVRGIGDSNSIVVFQFPNSLPRSNGAREIHVITSLRETPVSLPRAGGSTVDVWSTLVVSEVDCSSRAYINRSAVLFSSPLPQPQSIIISREETSTRWEPFTEIYSRNFHIICSNNNTPAPMPQSTPTSSSPTAPPGRVEPLRPQISPNSQSYQICENYQSVIRFSILAYAQQGVPLDTAMRTVQRLSIGSDFMMTSAAAAYRDPEGMRQMLDDGRWIQLCAQNLMGR